MNGRLHKKLDAPFPTSITNALSQKSTFTYGYNAGKLASSSDANGPPLTTHSAATTTYDYSEPGLLQRLTKVTYPIGSTTTYNYTDTPGSVSVSTTSTLNSCNTGNSVASETFYDGLVISLF